MPVKDQRALEQANSDAQRIVEILMGRFNVYAKSTENDSPLNNKRLGDVISDVGCFELQVSEKHPRFSLGKDKLTEFVGDGTPCYFLLGATRPGGMVFCLVPVAEVKKIVKAFDDMGNYYVIDPNALRVEDAIWGTSIEGVMLRFCSKRLLREC